MNAKCLTSARHTAPVADTGSLNVSRVLAIGLATSLAVGLTACASGDAIAQEQKPSAEKAVSQGQEPSTGMTIAAAQVDGDAALAARDANVEKRVAERTAATLKISPRRVGQYDARKGRIVVIGSASKQIKDPKMDKKGEWFVYRSMLAKQALLNAKMELAMTLGAEMSAEEAAETFDVPVSQKNPSGGVQNKVSSTVEFAAKHPIMGATVLYQEESYVDGEYKIALSLIWSKQLQASAAALLKGDENFKEEKAGKLTIDDWVDKQSTLPLMIGPRQFVDSDGIRHFIGISARAVGSNPALKQKNKIIAQNDARSTTMFSILADVEARTASTSLMDQYTENTDDLDAMSIDTVTESMSASISQKIEKLKIAGLSKFFEDTVEHPLCPGVDMYVVAYEIDAEGAREMQQNAAKLAKDHADVTKKGGAKPSEKAPAEKKGEEVSKGVFKVDGSDANATSSRGLKQGVVAADADADVDF